MVVENWLLQTIGEIFNRHLDISLDIEVQQQEQQADEKAKREWYGAIIALEKLLLPLIQDISSDNQIPQPVILSGGAPVISRLELLDYCRMGVFTPKALNKFVLTPFQLPGACKEKTTPRVVEFPLLPEDPLAEEQFCLVLTHKFALVMVLGKDAKGIPVFNFSFAPELIQASWLTLKSRLLLTNYRQLQDLEGKISQIPLNNPDYRLVTEFSRQLLKHIPDTNHKPRQIQAIISETPDKSKGDGIEMELLQALTHEIRTPLTTIRTLTKLLLKKAGSLSLPCDFQKRLETIDRECTEQINRMELIFRATQFKAKGRDSPSVQLIPMSLEQLFCQNIPHWQQQAQRRNVILDVVLPKKLPQVVTDPAMLERMLTGLMENCTRSLPDGGEIKVRVDTVGNQLKLQVVPQSCPFSNPMKSLGQLLMFRPETGSLSLNLDVTKNMFQALGGKFIVRHKPLQGEVVTIFLPLGSNINRQ